VRRQQPPEAPRRETQWEKARHRKLQEAQRPDLRHAHVRRRGRGTAKGHRVDLNPFLRPSCYLLHVRTVLWRISIVSKTSSML
jgi:hypothetical protein